MPLASLKTVTEELGVLFVLIRFLYLALPLLAATYGWSKGYPFFPLFLAGVLMPVFGPALVLLAVAIAGKRPRQT